MTPARRQKKRISIDVKFRGAGAGTNVSGRITDLSEMGLFLATQKYVPVGKQVHLEFELPTGKVEAVGEVRWLARGQVAEQGLGIRFLRLSAASARAIDDAVATGGRFTR
ncbi:MAG: PilZ domain-containing protein [Archangiaceae bacterium]|nr:PilZ domain-containing protein [Archangiaceae bacterium]